MIPMKTEEQKIVLVLVDMALNHKRSNCKTLFQHLECEEEPQH